MKIDTYKRNCIFSELGKFDYLSKKDDFIEICEWKNGDGFDITINEKTISLTRGQIKAIQTLTNLIDIDIDIDENYEKKS